eukprot:gene17021-20275_t
MHPVHWKHDTLHFVDAKTSEILHKQGTIGRQCLIRNSYNSIEEYRDTFIEAIHEDLNIRLVNIAQSFYQSCISLNNTSNNPSCKHGPTKRLITKKGPNTGREYYMCGASRDKQCVPSFIRFVDRSETNAPIVDNHTVTLPTDKKSQETEAFFHNRGVTLYMEAELIIKEEKNLAFDSNNPFGNSNGFGDNNNNNNQQPQPAIITTYFLVIKNIKKSQFARDDIWVLSVNASFSNNAFLVKSVFHGPSKTGVMEVKPFGELPRNLGHVNKVYAVHGPNASTELSMIALLNPTLYKADEETKYVFSLQMQRQEALDMANEYIEQYTLNEHQRRVLMECLNWFNFIDTDKDAIESPPALLVHGVFGSGKSTLLVVIIMFIQSLCEVGDNFNVRILVSSLTNVAVDRILIGLLQFGFTEFNRIGSVKKIAKPILPYTLHGSGRGGGSNDDAEALRELEFMLKKEALSDDEKKIINQTIDSIKSGKMSNRRKEFKQCRVVGATCASSLFSILSDQEFPIVFLDECSQMQEPLSLLPMCRSKCLKLVAVGDPLQLEPTIQSKPSQQVVNNGGGLEKTLFVRLSSLNIQPILLGTQYRCHPSISRLSNTLFYGNRLTDGITEQQRAPLIPNLAPIAFVEAEGGVETLDYSGSYYNDTETNIVLSLVDILTNSDKAQAFKITTKYQENRMKEQKQKQQNIVTEMDEDIDDDQGDGLTTKRFPFDSEEKDGSSEEEEEEEEQHKEKDEIKISTVDAFQGAERDIIIFSCSRTSFIGGFVDNPQRLNVAITRAKHHFIITGKSLALNSNPTWKTIISAATSKFSGKTIISKQSLY